MVEHAKKLGSNITDLGVVSFSGGTEITRVIYDIKTSYPRYAQLVKSDIVIEIHSLWNSAGTNATNNLTYTYTPSTGILMVSSVVSGLSIGGFTARIVILK